MLFALLLAALPAWAGTVSIQAQVTKLEVSQTTRVTVVVTGEDRTEVPTFPPSDGLQLAFAESSTSLRSSPQTGIVRTIAFTYLVQGLSPGTHVLGPATVRLRNGDELVSRPLQIEVVARGELPVPEEPLHLTATFPRDEVWEGEVVLYEAELVARQPIGQVTWRLPDFQGLTYPAHGDMETTRSRIGDPSGDITRVKSVIPLVATGTGERTQSPAVAEVDVVLRPSRGLLFSTRSRKKLVPADGPAKLRVRPLPSPPADFSGLVGDFELRNRLSDQQAVVGKTVRWTVQVLGDGIPDGFDLQVPEIPGASVYRDNPHVSGRLDGGRYLGVKTFHLQLVPTRPGRLEIPPLEVISFSPSTGRYETIRTEVGTLEVTGEAAESELTSFAGDDGPLPEQAPVELVDVYTWGFATVPPNAPWMPVLWALVSLPGGLLLLGEGGAAARRRWRSRPPSGGSSTVGAARLASLPEAPSERLATLDLALREALAAKLDTEVGSLRRDEALGSLHDDLSARVQTAFASLDRCRFAGDPPGPDLEAMVKDAIGRLR